GISAEERFDNLGPIRIIHALYDQENLSLTLLREFEYPTTVRRALAGDSNPRPGIEPPLRELENRESVRGPFLGRIDNLYKPTLFPSLRSNDYSARFTEQLSLPPGEEIYVAYSQYRVLSSQLLKRIFKDDTQATKAETIATEFSKFNQETQRTFLFYLQKPS